MGETLAEHQDAAVIAKLQMLLEGNCSKWTGNSDALLASTKKRVVPETLQLLAAAGAAPYLQSSIRRYSTFKQNDRLLGAAGRRDCSGHRYAHRGPYTNECGIPENSLLAFPCSCREGLLAPKLLPDQTQVGCCSRFSTWDVLRGVQKIVDGPRRASWFRLATTSRLQRLKFFEAYA